VQEVKVGQVKEAKLPERDGDADENTKSKAWSLLQHQSQKKTWTPCQEAWSSGLSHKTSFQKVS